MLMLKYYEYRNMKVILMFTKDFPAERHIYYDLKLDIFRIFRRSFTKSINCKLVVRKHCRLFTIFFSSKVLIMLLFWGLRNAHIFFLFSFFYAVNRFCHLASALLIKLPFNLSSLKHRRTLGKKTNFFKFIWTLCLFFLILWRHCSGLYKVSVV